MPEDKGREAPFDYERLVGVIRDELDRGLKPVTDGLVRVEEAVKQTYSREVMDEKLKQRDEKIEAQGQEIKDLKQIIGSFWTNKVTQAGAVLGLVALLVELWKAFN